MRGMGSAIVTSTLVYRSAHVSYDLSTSVFILATVCVEPSTASGCLIRLMMQVPVCT